MDITRVLITLEADLYQQRIEKLVWRHGGCLSYSEDYVENEWQQYTCIWIALFRAANKEPELFPVYTYFLGSLRKSDPMPMHHVGSRGYRDKTVCILKINTRWQWIISLALRTLYPEVILRSICIVQGTLKSSMSVSNSDGEHSCPCWESNACLTVLSQSLLTSNRKQKSRMEALFWRVATITWWCIMYDIIGDLTCKSFH
jgi:hypothetical protein